MTMPDLTDTAGFQEGYDSAGYGMNVGVPGAFAAPETGGPVTDTLEQQANITSGTGALNDIGISALYDPGSYSTLNNAMNSLPNNLLSGVANAVPGFGSNGSAQQQAIPSAIGADSGQAIPSAFTGGAQAAAGQAAAPPAGQAAGGQDGAAAAAPPPIPPISWTSGGGTLSADVPNADDSLLSALQGAYSGGGGAAALVAGTVTLSGTSIMAGEGLAPGIAYGVEGGQAPQFHGGSHIFYPTVQAWYDEMVAEMQAQQQAQQQQAAAAGGGALEDSGGVPAYGGSQQTNNAIDQAINNAFSGFGDNSGTPGGELPDTANQGLVDRLTNGGNDIWSSPLGGIDDMAHAPPQDAMGYSSPLGGVYTNAASTAAGFDDPNSGFYGLGHDPLDNTVSDPGDNIWSSPLGGIY